MVKISFDASKMDDCAATASSIAVLLRQASSAVSSAYGSLDSRVSSRVSGLSDAVSSLKTLADEADKLNSFLTRSSESTGKLEKNLISSIQGTVSKKLSSDAVKNFKSNGVLNKVIEKEKEVYKEAEKIYGTEALEAMKKVNRVSSIIKETFLRNQVDEYGNVWEFYKTADGIDAITVNGKFLNIFGYYNLKSGQYGGSQIDLTKSVFKKADGTYNFTDKYIYNTLKKYFPDASDNDYYSYLNIIKKSACQYTACVNTLFKHYEGRENEFYKTFGFPMYEVAPNGYIDYNYEKLIVDYYSYVESKLGLQVKNIDSVPTKMESGTSYAQEMFGEFLSQYNVHVDSGSNQYMINASNNIQRVSNLFTALNPLGNLNESLKLAYLSNQKEEDSHMIIALSNFNLYSVEDNHKGKITDSNVGAHAMYVTGITDDGYLKVSSWGKEYSLDLSELPLSADTSCSYQIIKY